MNIQFTQGDSIIIPEGCTATIKDGIITFQQQEPEQYFKDGDILIDDAKPNDATHKIIMIYKGERNSEGAYKSYILMNLSGLLVQGCCCWRCMPRREIRLATEEEKQELFDVMKEKGLYWNAEEKRVEKIRWRAKINKSYYMVRTLFNISGETEAGWDEDNDNYNNGNYFRTRKQAEQAVEAPHRRDRVWIVAHHTDTRAESLQQGGQDGILGFGPAINTEGKRRTKGGHDYGKFEIPQEKERRAEQFSGADSPQSWWRNFPTQSPICSRDDGLSARLDAHAISFSKWRAESVAAYGNAWVPQVAYEIFQAIELQQTIQS